MTRALIRRHDEINRPASAPRVAAAAVHRRTSQSSDVGGFSHRVMSRSLRAERVGCWAQLLLEVERQPQDVFAFASTEDTEGFAPHNRFELVEQIGARPSGPRRFSAIRFLPERSATIAVEILARGPMPPTEPRFAIRPLPRWKAALLLLRHEPARLHALLRDLRGAPLARWTGLLRRRLAAPSAPRRDPAQEYNAWIDMFGAPPGKAASLSGGPSVGVVVFAPPCHSSTDAVAVTLASLTQQAVQPSEVIIVRPGTDPRLPNGRYVAVVQAGEILPPWAIATAAQELRRRGLPELAMADEDSTTPSGERVLPLFKPQPNRALMLSGTLGRGLWLFRRDVLESLGMPKTVWGEEARLELWFRLYEARGITGLRLPFILSHRSPATATTPSDQLAAPVSAHLKRVKAPMRALPSHPVSLSLEEAKLPAVDVIVPSGLRRRHIVPCLQRILQGTDYPDLRLLVGVAQPGSLDAEQESAARALRTLGARVTRIEMAQFNFSATINALAASGEAEYVLLLNDDVAPIRRDWLRWMAAFLQDRRTAAVGARLLYPDGSVQHGGVLMGLGGLCEHAHRGLPGSAPGYAWRAVLAQELSAVTGACMLVRRRRFEEAGGLDETYPSAFNDIDFCLRLREAGYGVVYAPQAELTHLELQTYGSHYTGARASHQAEETARMLRRWSGVIREDPYHNPNLRLEPGFEWRPAFPPRVSPA